MNRIHNNTLHTSKPHPHLHPHLHHHVRQVNSHEGIFEPVHGVCGRHSGRVSGQCRH